MATMSSIEQHSSTQQFIILWLDSEVNNSEDNLIAQQRLFNTFDNVEIFEDENNCQQFIRSKRKQSIILIVSGRLSRQIVPAINLLEQVYGIYIYCMDESRHVEWANGFPKIKGIIIDLEKLMAQIQTDLKKLKKKKPPVNSIEEITYTLEATEISSSTNNNNNNSNPSHLDGYKKMPLGSLEDAIAPLKDIVGDIEQMAYIVKYNAPNPEDGLTSDESASIGLFTMEWCPTEKSFGFILNEILRTENKEQIKPWFRYLRLLFKALSKLQSLSQPIYQGTKEDVSRGYQKSSIFISWQFMTCTASIKTLENEETFGKTGQRTLFTIQSQTGKDIRRHAYDPEKDQVLLLPGRQFQVISCLSPDDNLNIIQLEELKSLYSFE